MFLETFFSLKGKSWRPYCISDGSYKGQICVCVHVLTVISTCKLDRAEAEDRRPAASWSRGALTLWHWHTRVVIYCLVYTVVWVMSYECVFVSVVILVAGSEEIIGLMSDIYSVAPSFPLYLLPVSPPLLHLTPLTSPLSFFSLSFSLYLQTAERSQSWAVFLCPAMSFHQWDSRITSTASMPLRYASFCYTEYLSDFDCCLSFFLSYSCTFSWFLVKNKTWNDSLWAFLIYWCPVSQLNHQNHLNIKI